VPRRRVLPGAVAALGGLLAGVLGSFVHAVRVAGFPVGLPAALALCLAVFLATGLASRRRGPVALAALTWLAVVVLLSARRPEGDIVVPGTGLGYAWLLGGTVAAALAVSLPYAPSAEPPDRR
jgi:hypothetical protein